MKNKKLLYTAILVAMVSLNVSCSDNILQEEPKAVAQENFYKTADEVEGAVFGIYSPFRYVMGDYGFRWMMTASQVTYAQGRFSFVDYTDFQNPFGTANITRSRGAWQNFYASVRNANEVIEKAPDAPNATEEEINELVAEARFLRGLAYFYMVRHWGPIPIRTPENKLETDVPRSPVVDVYNLIVSDLEYSEMNLPEDQSMAGRPDRYAAKAVLSHVYLQLERWTDSRDKALEIINSDRYSLVEVETSDDFYKIFGPDVNDSPEEIFYFKYNYTSGSVIARYRHYPGRDEYFNNTGVYALYVDTVAHKEIREWDHKDLRKDFNFYSQDIGEGPHTMLFKKWIDPEAPTDHAKNDYPAYRYADILLNYAEADARVNNGPTPDGIEKLNMIRRRGYGYNPNEPSPVDYDINDYPTLDSFIDVVLQEGMYEQIDEAKRFLKLIRTGRLDDVVKENLGYEVSECVYLWPIPNTEISYNGAISPSDQNPCY